MYSTFSAPVMNKSKSKCRSGYTYTLLKDLRIGDVVNVYGVVKFAKPPYKTRGRSYCSIVHLIDDSCVGLSDTKLSCCLFSEDPDDLPCPDIGDIVRFHRLSIVSYNNTIQGKNRLGSVSWLIFSGGVDDPVEPYSKSNSKSYNFTTTDKEKVQQLRNWSNGISCLPGSTTGVVRTFSEVTDSTFFDIYCQVVYTSTLDPSRLFLVWDGTKCQLPLRNVTDYMVDHDVERDEHLIRKAAGYLYEVTVYDNHVEDTRNIKPGDFVHIHGLHADEVQDRLGRPAYQFRLHYGSTKLRHMKIVDGEDPVLVTVRDRQQSVARENGYSPSHDISSQDFEYNEAPFSSGPNEGNVREEHIDNKGDNSVPPELTSEMGGNSGLTQFCKGGNKPHMVERFGVNVSRNLADPQPSCSGLHLKKMNPNQNVNTMHIDHNELTDDDNEYCSTFKEHETKSDNMKPVPVAMVHAKSPSPVRSLDFEESTFRCSNISFGFSANLSCEGDSDTSTVGDLEAEIERQIESMQTVEERNEVNIETTENKNTERVGDVDMLENVEVLKPVTNNLGESNSHKYRFKPQATSKPKELGVLTAKENHRVHFGESVQHVYNKDNDSSQGSVDFAEGNDFGGNFNDSKNQKTAIAGNKECMDAVNEESRCIDEDSEVDICMEVQPSIEPETQRTCMLQTSAIVLDHPHVTRSTIEQVLNHSVPYKFRVRARIVDYHPKPTSLRHFLKLYCVMCHYLGTLPDKQQQENIRPEASQPLTCQVRGTNIFFCPRCNQGREKTRGDPQIQLEPIYMMRFILQDKTGLLLANVWRAEAVKLFQDLEPTQLLKFNGNLKHVRDLLQKICPDKVPQTDRPYFECCIRSYSNKDGTGFQLFDTTIV